MKSPIVLDLEPLESCYSDLMVLKSAAGYYIGVCETPIDRGRSLPQPCGTCKPCSAQRYALENI